MGEIIAASKMEPQEKYRRSPAKGHFPNHFLAGMKTLPQAAIGWLQKN
jgi:hypothetical protein